METLKIFTDFPTQNAYGIKRARRGLLREFEVMGKKRVNKKFVLPPCKMKH